MKMTGAAPSPNTNTFCLTELLMRFLPSLRQAMLSLSVIHLVDNEGFLHTSNRSLPRDHSPDFT